MNGLVSMIMSAFDMLDKQYTLPWIGKTSILRMIIFVALLDMLAVFIASLIGGKSDE